MSSNDEIHLKPTEKRILDVLKNNAPDGHYFAVQRIGILENIDRGNLTRYIKNLEQKELITVIKETGKVFIQTKKQTKEKTKKQTKDNTNKQIEHYEKKILLLEIGNKDLILQNETLVNDNSRLLKELKKLKEKRKMPLDSQLKIDLNEMEEHLGIKKKTGFKRFKEWQEAKNT